MQKKGMLTHMPEFIGGQEFLKEGVLVEIKNENY
jgi:hypothetical protein